MKESVYEDNLLVNSGLFLGFKTQDVFDIFHHAFAYDLAKKLEDSSVWRGKFLVEGHFLDR